ncbi:MAG: DUF4003 domain-containing protein [Methanomassiliicoccaceae archaeon]|nr:DUF4003 domain-containing protein [Methanomassiliicoccaceae archaeon]
MKHGTRWKLELFAENTRKAKKGLGLKSVMAKRFAALLYALEGKPLDHNAVMNAYAAMKAAAGVLSVFRGNTSIFIAAMSSLKGDPKVLFDRTSAVYDMMKDAGFWRSDFLAVAAYTVAANAEPKDYQATVDRMRTFYEGMKAQRWLFTGADDNIFAAMLALSGVDPKEGVERIGQFYILLGPGFLAKNSVLMLSQILVACEMPVQTADRVIALRDAFRERKIPLDRAYTLPLLGILAMLPVDVNTVVQDITEAQTHLREQKGFGVLSVQKQELLLYAASIVVSGYAEDVESGIVTATTATSITNMIIAMQVAMVVVAAAAANSAASAAAASGG